MGDELASTAQTSPTNLLKCLWYFRVYLELWITSSTRFFKGRKYSVVPTWGNDCSQASTWCYCPPQWSPEDQQEVLPSL